MTFDLVVSLGDPRGIGPEMVSAAIDELLADQPGLRFLVLGAEEVALRSSPAVTFEPTGTFDGTEESAGASALRAIELGTEVCLDGRGGALMTAPIHKPALRAAGSPFPGHTELLGALAGSPEVGMLMHAEHTSVGGTLRVLLATTHLALREVPGAVTTDLIVRQTRLLHRELQERWGIQAPRVALCALNPHASDGGLFGTEEEDVLVPALRRMEEAGILVAGPIPADTVFSRALRGEFDVVVAPYHDVGMAAFKTASFGSGVNVTLGLPFVRTSPDHGTAFDLVGTGRADASSTLEAMRLAIRLAARPGRTHLAGVRAPPVVPASQRDPEHH